MFASSNISKTKEDGHRLNIIFTGFPYPKGMAGTKRCEHAIRALREYKDISIRVLIGRQISCLNPFEGDFDGVPFKSVTSSVARGQFLLKYPVYFVKSVFMLRKYSAINNLNQNILYVYGSPSIENLPMILTAMFSGYKIIFDVVEDEYSGFKVSWSWWQKINNLISRFLIRAILPRADGIITLNGQLEKKISFLTKGVIPILQRPISIDTALFTDKMEGNNHTTDILYSGSFAATDGVENLIQSFESIAEINKRVRLLLTGRGDKTRIESILDKIKRSDYGDRILYLGYLDEMQYYDTLKKADILCCPRIDTVYAHMGFPFKLGEFLASGKPVVVSRTGDVELFLENKHSAIIIQAGNVEALTDGISYLIENPDAAKRIGANGRKIALTYFDYRKHGGKLLSFMRSV